MSWEVVGIVSKKQCGGAVRRVLLLTLASTCGNDGRDIYSSVAQLGRDSEVDPRTVQRTLKAFISEGLLEHVAERKCPRGYTNEYRLRMSAIYALPNIIRREDIMDDDPRHSATGGKAPPRQRVTPDRSPPLTDSHPSKAKAPETSGDIASDPRQTATRGEPPPPAQRHPTLFPSTSENPSVESSVVCASEQTSDTPQPLPANWKPSPKLRRKAIEELFFTEEEIDDATVEFIDYWRPLAKRKQGRKTERGWQATFGTRLNSLAAQWRTQYRRNASRGSGPGPGHQHSGNAILDAVARRRSSDQAEEYVPSGSSDR